MSDDVEKTIGDLKQENLDLRFTVIRNDIEGFKTTLVGHLTRIEGQTLKTNGSVARVVQRLADVEKLQEEVTRIEAENNTAISILKEHTKVLGVLVDKKWVSIVTLACMYALTLEPVRTYIGAMVKILF